MSQSRKKEAVMARVRKVLYCKVKGCECGGKGIIDAPLKKKSTHTDRKVRKG
jgi:hypothetical protein